MATADKSQAKEKKKVRAARGSGRLYKRSKDGKEHPADKKIPGVFWIQYSIQTSEINPKTGKPVLKRVRHALTGKDGKPITELRKAEVERKRLTAPLRAGKREAQVKALQAVAQQATEETEQAIENAVPILRIADAWESYLQSPERPDAGEDTLLAYRSYWKHFIGWQKEKREDLHALRDITPQIASDFAADLSGGQLGPNTFNKHIAFLKLFFRVLEDAAGLKENPFAKVRRKNPKINVRRELTIAELKEILEKATGDLQTLLCLGTFTGLRLGDCCTLTWGEVDLDRGLIRRVPNKTAKGGKPVLIGIPSALQVKLSEEPPTSRKGYVVPRFAELYTYRSAAGRPIRRADITNEIQAHFKTCGIQTVTAGTGKKAYEAALEKWEQNGKKGVEPAKKRAILEVGFHSLRHTWVSLHAAAGTPQAVIQKVVGHASPAMTAHYTHINEDTARQVAGVLTLNEPEQRKEPIPDWALEKLKKANEKNAMQIIAELIGGKK